MPPKRRRAAAGKRSRAKPEIHENSAEGTPIPLSPDRSHSRERSEEVALHPEERVEAPRKEDAKPEAVPDPTTTFPPQEQAPVKPQRQDPVMPAERKEERPQPPLPRSQQRPPQRPPRGSNESPQAPLPSRGGNNKKPRLGYNPFDTREWGLECVDTHSRGYQDAVSRARRLFPFWLRSSALQGERLLHEVRTNVERRAVVDVGRQFGFGTSNPKGNSCRFVYVKASEKLYMRSGPGNPYLGEEMAKQLSRMEIEFRRYTARRDGKPEPITPMANEGPHRSRPHRDNMVLHWAFTDLFVHRDVIEVLRLLAFDLGVFRGRPSPSADELASCYEVQNSVIDADYIYPIDISLEYDPRWADEIEYICRQPGKDGKPGIVPYSPEDPYPPSDAIRYNADALHHYRCYVRPFMYNWNPTCTHCATEMRLESASKPPPLATLLGSVFSLRWSNEQGRVTMHRWLRHSLSLFSQYSPSFLRQDELTICLTMQELQKRRPELRPVELLKQAKELTPHFGMLNLCLNFTHFRRELGELQSFAEKAQFFIYMREEKSDVYVAAAARDLPVLRPQEFTLLFTSIGSFVGPSYLGLREINPKLGEGKEVVPSMLFLINRFDAPPSKSDDGSGEGKNGKDDRRRRRSPSNSRSDHSDSENAGRGRRHRHRGEDERSSDRRPPQESHPAPHAAPAAPTPPPAPAVYLPHVPGYPQSPPPPPQQPPQQQQQQQPAPMPGYPVQPVGLPGVYSSTPSLVTPPQVVPYAYPAPPVAAYSYPPQLQQGPRRSRYLPPHSLPASSLYDTVMGLGQRQCPVGQTVETKLVEWRIPGAVGAPSTPAGPPVPVTFVMDHVKREALIAPPMPR